MIRPLVVVSSFAVALAGFGFATPASAEPVSVSDETTEASCVYTLSPASLVQVSGTTMVTATLTPYPCTGSISPNYMSVCVKPGSDASAGRCGFSAVPTYAEVFVPYTPGTTYTVTGTGCGSVYSTQGSLCASEGPVKTTL